ncbi:hypothetical protein B0H19DRAFT_1064214 [Mycena capillaripes]|nr:hypothetical protein B0H19DRAFT_1064214 [Mycena capillaripes]
MVAIDPRLPPGLERNIFELAGIGDLGMIQISLRVARRVRIWMEVFLHRVMFVDRYSHSKKTYALLGALHFKPAAFLSDAVRHLYLDLTSILSPAETRTLLRLCENITSLAVIGRCAEPGLLPILATMHLRRLSIKLGGLFASPPAIDFTHPLFTSITHLYLMDRFIPTHSQVTALPSLTHLCLNETVSWKVFRDLLLECKTLELLVNLWPSYLRAHAQQSTIKLPFADPRFVVASMDFASYRWDWEAGAERGADFWAAAEDFVTQKRRGEIDDSVHWMGHHESHAVEQCKLGLMLRVGQIAGKFISVPSTCERTVANIYICSDLIHDLEHGVVCTLGER